MKEELFNFSLKIFWSLLEKEKRKEKKKGFLRFLKRSMIFGQKKLDFIFFVSGFRDLSLEKRKMDIKIIFGREFGFS